MGSKPHSKTVRGTLDNPKTREAMKSDEKTPQLGDATSLKPENDSPKLPSNDSAPPAGQGNDTGAPKVSDMSPKSERAASVEPKEELPHSKKVRGTLANDNGKKVNKTQLGDPASLKAETSKSSMGREVEREGGDKSGKSKL
ncbi:hypothetical protein EK21DRAFT_77970 [Setomelanomma holmii]|uniref:Uncharacterized protein n=1 Tax=Setomelanomma holmii TaxID=210430 RepID=A0A9P4H130_9PLEO|nr:hypothetical protein EK21DRAFT_77970 [Setomelanomma holmii]